jgi:hypothetical protein
VRGLAHAALWCGLASTLAQAQPYDSAIAGVVAEDHSGVPVRSALVRLFPLVPVGGRGALKELETDRDGKFEFAALQSGSYRIEVGKANYVPTIVSLDAWRAAADVDARAFHLVRHGIIAGRTVPPGSAQIVAVETVPAGVEPRQFPATRDENSAEFRVFGLPPGSYILAAANGRSDGAPRHGVVVYPGAPRPRAFTIAGGEEYLDIEMPIPSGDAFAVRGRMVVPDDGTRDPVSLRLRATDHPWALVWSRLLRSNEPILIEHVVPGRYELTGTVGFGAAQRLSGKVVFDLDRPGLDDLELPLEPVHAPAAKTAAIRAPDPGAIRGHVPGASAPVFVVLTDRTPGRTSPIRAALVRPGGDFAFVTLEPGRYHVAAHPAASSGARWVSPSRESDPIDLPAGESRSIDVRFGGER